MRLQPRRPRRHATLRRAALVAFSTSLSLALAEAALRVVAPPLPVGVATTGTPKAELYGWAWPPNLDFEARDPDTGRRYPVRTNAEGWKDVDHARGPAPGRTRILVVGDSNTWGVVPLERLYTRRLEEMLHRRGHADVEVISMGVGGWGTDQALEALALEGLAYRPDLVVHQFCGNDVLNNDSPNGFLGEDRLEWAKRFRYRLEDGRLVRVALEPRHVEPPGGRWKARLRATALGFHLAAAKRRLFPPDVDPVRRPPLPGEAPLLDPGDPYFLYGADGGSPELRAAWELTAALLAEMKARVEASGATFVVFSEEGESGKRDHNLQTRRLRSDRGGDFVVRDGLRVPVRWTAPLEKLREACAAHGIRLVEPRRTYTRFRSDPHPNAAGNEAMARDLADALEPLLGARTPRTRAATDPPPVRASSVQDGSNVAPPARPAGPPPGEMVGASTPPR